MLCFLSVIYARYYVNPLNQSQRDHKLSSSMLESWVVQLVRDVANRASLHIGSDASSEKMRLAQLRSGSLGRAT